MKSFALLQSNPADQVKVNQLIQLLSSDNLTPDYQLSLAFIAAEYKVCSASPALIKLLGNQFFIIEPQFGKMSPDEALISLGACSHQYLKEYLINGNDLYVKNVITQIMWHYVGSDKVLVDTLTIIKTHCTKKENLKHLDNLISRIENRMR